MNTRLSILVAVSVSILTPVDASASPSEPPRLVLREKQRSPGAPVSRVSSPCSNAVDYYDPCYEHPYADALRSSRSSRASSPVTPPVGSSPSGNSSPGFVAVVGTPVSRQALAGVQRELKGSPTNIVLESTKSAIRHFNENKRPDSPMTALGLADAIAGSSSMIPGLVLFKEDSPQVRRPVAKRAGSLLSRRGRMGPPTSPALGSVPVSMLATRRVSDDFEALALE